MHINKIYLENFRCFKDYEIEFGLKSTVLIGKNGTGKTNLINALKKGMSFMFAKSQEHRKSLSDSNNCSVRAFNLWDTRFDNIERGFNFPTKTHYVGQFNNEPIEWTFFKKKHPGSLHPTQYSNALNQMLSFYNSNVAEAYLPVLAFFSDSYPHILNNVGSVAAQIIKTDILPRDFGYYGWDEEANCIELWQRRFIKVYNGVNDIRSDLSEIEEQIEWFNHHIRNADEYDSNKIPEWEERIEALTERFEELKKVPVRNDFQTELNFIVERILTFTAPLRNDLNLINKEFQLRRVAVTRPDRKEFQIEFAFVNGNSMFFDHLPQGYKRLFSMVFDIAYRSYILNLSKEPVGMVFIDEIELHLHPTLQQEVLSRFKKTFPKIQFVVSTHSPLVITNLKVDGIEDKIVTLENDGNNFSRKYLGNIYGIDYTTGLMDIMGAKYRSSDIDNLIDSYVTLKLRNKDEGAKKIWEEIFSIVGTKNERIAKEINDKVEANR